MFKLQHTLGYTRTHTTAGDTKKNKFYCWKGGGWILYLTLEGELKKNFHNTRVQAKHKHTLAPLNDAVDACNPRLGQFNLAIYLLKSHHRISSFSFLFQHHWHRAGRGQMVSCQAATVGFSAALAERDSQAGCRHSAQRGWLIICQPPWGLRPACQQQAQCFSEQRWRLERVRLIRPLCGQEGRKSGGSKDKSKQRREGGFFSGCLSRGQKVAARLWFTVAVAF